MTKSLYEILTEKGEEIGLKKGKDIGKEEKALEVAADCIKLGMDNSTIAKIARIAIEKVELIRDAIQQGTFTLQS